MKISRQFKIAIKLADRPAYRIAQDAKVDVHWLSKAIHGAVELSENDPRIYKLATILGLRKEEIFEKEGVKL